MKLTHVRIKNFRSFYGEHDFPLSAGPNYFVGPNNCGKSNLVRALELALDPDAEYIPDRDRPVQGGRKGRRPETRITLTFQVPDSGPERTLLRRARLYELAVRAARGDSVSDDMRTFADDGEIRVVASFDASGARQTAFQTKASGAATLPTSSTEYKQLAEQFEKVLRFAVVHSGEDLESLLAGKFREILQLVINDHLKDQIGKARAAREAYLATLQSELLGPLRDKILDRVGDIFPEITGAELVPTVPTVDDTLSSVDVQLGDVVMTQLGQKGTGVRGGVLVSMLQYLAQEGRRSMVLAVEEPEAFLHPAAQEAIRHELDELSLWLDVTLVVTTHSPYVISHRDDSRITALTKDSDGTTRRVGTATAASTEERARLLASLYRDIGVSELLEGALNVPDEAEVILITEGYTDGLFLELVCKAVSRLDLLKGLHFVVAGKASKVVAQAILTKASTHRPVIALLDHDENGDSASDTLTSGKFGWRPDGGVLNLRAWPGACTTHEIEIEDLLPSSAVNAVIASLGRDASYDAMVRCGTCLSGQRHSLSDAWKKAAIEQLADHLPASDPGGMVWLAEEIRRRADRLIDSRARSEVHRQTESAMVR